MPGMPGFLGATGQKGMKGARGHSGSAGTPGLGGPTGKQGAAGEIGIFDGSFVFARHSQSTDVPTCPADTIEIYKGYSFMGMQGDSYAHLQDLGTSGSCLIKFSAMPFMFCDIMNTCHYATRNDYSYWLATNNPMKSDMGSWNAREIEPYVSRCIVCESATPLFAVHSQTMSIPECPEGYNPLWEGYSHFIASADGGHGGAQTLSSPGSCLQHHLGTPYFHCKSSQQCNFYPHFMSFYLAAMPENEDFNTQVREETLKPDAKRRARMSRCRVCAANLYLVTPGRPSIIDYGMSRS